MEDQLISFETAKLAKKKGFNESCIWMYFAENKKFKICHTKMDMNGHANNYSNAYSAPTQSLLQKWLREKGDVILFVKPHRLPGSEITWFHNIHTGKQDWSWYEKTYEKALETGLVYALKLIEEK